MGLRKVAIIGAGITKFHRYAQETPKELAYEASKMALDSCGMNLKDVESVALGTAPDAFDGIHMKGEYLLDGAGGFRKPYMRHYVPVKFSLHMRPETEDYVDVFDASFVQIYARCQRCSSQDS